MMNDMIWNAFKKTGDINMYLEMKEIQKLKENMKDGVNEADKGKWSDFSRK